ncbi:MAG: helix-turn-helix domain-containing protein [Coriobacteriales bacterium]|mgnify:FL=1|jgi:bacteriophage CI repressor helix-turn-helix domain
MNMEIFGRRVKKELKEQGKTQVALAKYLHVQKSTISEWLNDNNEPPMKCIVEIANFLDVTTDYLLGLEDEFGTKYKNEIHDNHGNITFNQH